MSEKPKVSPFRQALQRKTEVNICRYGLTDAQLQDLCQELCSPTCYIKRLKYGSRHVIAFASE